MNAWIDTWREYSLLTHGLFSEVLNSLDNMDSKDRMIHQAQVGKYVEKSGRSLI
jgi:hypothetical protein